MGKTKYCYRATEDDREKIKRLLQRFTNERVYANDDNNTVVERKWTTLSDIFEFVVETKKDVFCKTVENDYVVAGYSRGKVGFSWDIVKQARMYADFG